MQACVITPEWLQFISVVFYQHMEQLWSAVYTTQSAIADDTNSQTLLDEDFMTGKLLLPTHRAGQ